MTKGKKIYNNFLDKGKDRALFWKLKKKDENAFLEVYERYVDDVYRFVYFKVGGSEEAQDITSIVFLKTWNYVQENKLQESKSLKSFVYKVARNCVVDYYRQNRVGQTVDIDDEDSGVDLTDESQDIAREVELSLEIALVKEKLNELKDEYREIIILRYINELSFSEIAEITGRSKNSTRVLVHRALKTLRDILEEEKKFKS